mmetsp:Transcript_17999/g.38841  ORF Transcript_17999/g.38841 Transcript_17999/m.38841 type:complete len:213 (+) Transcript_17999:893-1531(+)
MALRGAQPLASMADSLQLEGKMATYASGLLRQSLQTCIPIVSHQHRLHRREVLPKLRKWTTQKSEGSVLTRHFQRAVINVAMVLRKRQVKKRRRRPQLIHLTLLALDRRLQPTWRFFPQSRSNVSKTTMLMLLISRGVIHTSYSRRLLIVRFVYITTRSRSVFISLNMPTWLRQLHLIPTMTDISSRVALIRSSVCGPLPTDEFETGLRLPT